MATSLVLADSSILYIALLFGILALGFLVTLYSGMRSDWGQAAGQSQLTASAGCNCVTQETVEKLREELQLWRSGGSQAAVTLPQAQPAPAVLGNPLAVIADQENEFKKICDKHETDKVTTHRYHPIYEKYLRYFRSSPVRMLEIGLGCGMSYGPGHSIGVWKDYFPQISSLYIVEYDGGCAAPFMDKVTELFVGDQSNITFMEDVGRKVAPPGGLDFVMDDGGHKSTHMRNSFTAMLKYVRPGGLYFIEDLLTQFMTDWLDNGEETMTLLTRQIMDVKHDVTNGKEHPELARTLAGLIEYVECWAEICVFVRNNAPAAL